MVNLAISAVVLLAMNWFEQRSKTDVRRASRPLRVRGAGGAR